MGRIQNGTVSGHDAVPKNFSDVLFRNWHVKSFYDIDTASLKVLSHHWEVATLAPMLAMVVLAVAVFLMILFKQNPILIIGTVAACLTMIAIYLILNSLSESKLVYD